jgi:hypothetical protein
MWIFQPSLCQQCGAQSPSTACLTRWEDENQRIEVVIGERVDLLAGKAKTVLGLPGDAEQWRNLTRTSGSHSASSV